jgi:hypothetical protein
VVAKVRHECERCGHQSGQWDKVAKRDDELAELHDDFMAMERSLKVLLHYERSRLTAAHERIEQMRELLNMLPDPVPEIEFVDDSQDPFI